MYVTLLLFLRLARQGPGDLSEGDVPVPDEALRLKREAESKIEEWRRAAEAGQIGPGEYNRFTRRWNEQRIRAEETLERLVSEAKRATTLDAKIVEAWPELTPYQRREAFRAAFSKIVIEPQAKNRFDPRCVSVQWQGADRLLKGGNVAPGAHLKEMLPDRIGYEHWTPEQRQRLGWEDPRFGWPGNWLETALGVAWGGLAGATDPSG